MRKQRAQPLSPSQISIENTRQQPREPQSTRKYLSRTKIYRRKQERQNQKRKTKIELLSALASMPTHGLPTSITSSACVVDCYWDPSPPSLPVNAQEVPDFLVVVPHDEISLTPQGLDIAQSEMIGQRKPGSLPRHAKNKGKY